MRTPSLAAAFSLVALVVVFSGCATEPPDDCSSNGTCPITADATADSWNEGASDSPQNVESGPETTPDAPNEVEQDGGTAEGGDARPTVDATVDSADGGDSGPDQDAGDAGDAADGFDGFDGYACDPSQPPHDQPCVIDERYGLFVAPAASGGSDATGDGTRAKPYASIGHALGNLGAKSRVYVCDAAYAESVTLRGPASLFGGLECPAGDAGWGYLGSGAQVTAPLNTVALRVEVDSGPVDVEDLRFVASNASGQDDAGNGASSIAAIVNGSLNVTFRRCVFAAGGGENGAPGTDGANAPNYPVAQVLAQAGSDQDGGAGGAGSAVTCADGHKSSGGNGGSSGPGGGGGGVAGTSVPEPISPDGAGGAGGTTFCGAGAHPGANGAAGIAGARPTSFGALLASGWTPSPGGSGQNGDPGQGGGGGGGLLTLGGTGGGAGGCGGAGGTGGGGGGASVALECADSDVVLDGCTLTSAAAGSGGRGGNGQPGQGGGNPGLPSIVQECVGGTGGNGAGGSAGAGGAGGISTCFLYRGALPSQLEGTTCVPGAAGAPGPSGTGGSHGTSSVIPTGNDGSDGPDGGLPGLSQPAYSLSE